MKKYIYFFSLFVLLLSCSTRNNSFINRVYHNFTAYYNTLFNGNEALLSEINKRKKKHQDNFNEEYIKLLPYEHITAKDQEPQKESTYGVNSTPNTTSVTINSLEEAEAKALKTISNHSIEFNRIEKNKEIFNAYLLLIRARIYQGKYPEAIETMSLVESKMDRDKRIVLVKIYKGLSYYHLKDYEKAKQIFDEIKKDRTLKRSHLALLNIYQAENYLALNDKTSALESLKSAFIHSKEKTLKSRIAFLKGQILVNSGLYGKAKTSFETASQLARTLEFEVKSKIEFAKSFIENLDEYEKGKKYLEELSKKGIYTSYKNEFYYALSIMADKVGLKKEAREYLDKSLKEKISDPQIRGLVFYKIGQLYFKKDDYIRAGAYYDSAITVMSYEPMKKELQKTHENIKKFIQNYYLIKKNDSILNLANMSDEDRKIYFTKYIAKLKEKENTELKKQEVEKKNIKVNNQFRGGFYSQNENKAFIDFSENNKRTFYFANQNTIARGLADFKSIWGQRTLKDNWRYSSSGKTSIEQVKGEIMGISKGDSRRFETDYYIEKIPTNKEELHSLKKARDTASLGLGDMYHNFFSNEELATKTWYDLADSPPAEEKVKKQALYKIFSLNHKKDPKKAERAKQIILQEFPQTSYAEFVKNPQSNNLLVASPEAIKDYEQAYSLHSKGKYKESNEKLRNVIKIHHRDNLLPKMLLLQAFNTAKIEGKEAMMLQINQLYLNYENTPEGQRAKEIYSMFYFI